VIPKFTDMHILRLAFLLARDEWVADHQRHFKHIMEEFSWDTHLTEFQREQWTGRAKLHLIEVFK
jgi:hypothetical protein